jgi:hypothetical protein
VREIKSASKMNAIENCGTKSHRSTFYRNILKERFWAEKFVNRDEGTKAAMVTWSWGGWRPWASGHGCHETRGAHGQADMGAMKVEALMGTRPCMIEARKHL